MDRAKLALVSFPWSSVITGAVAFAGIGYGANLSGKRETLSWSRDQRLEAYVELMTAIETCYGAFHSSGDYDRLRSPAGARHDAKVRKAVKDWRKRYDEIQRRLAAADMVGSERFMDNPSTRPSGMAVGSDDTCR